LVPEFHRVSGRIPAPGRGLYRQWGIAPRPEDIGFSCLWHIIRHRGGNCNPLAEKLSFGSKRRRRRTPGFPGPGPKARKAGQQNQGICAGREKDFFVEHPLGTGAEAPEIFWVLLYLYKSTSPGGETSPSLVPPAGEVFKRADVSLHFGHPAKARAEPLPYITSVFAPMDSETKTSCGTNKINIGFMSPIRHGRLEKPPLGQSRRSADNSFSGEDNLKNFDFTPMQTGRIILK